MLSCIKGNSRKDPAEWAKTGRISKYPRDFDSFNNKHADLGMFASFMAKDELWMGMFVDADGLGKTILLQKSDTVTLNRILSIMHRHRKDLAMYAKDDGLKHVFDLLEHLIEWQPEND